MEFPWQKTEEETAEEKKRRLEEEERARKARLYTERQFAATKTEFEAGVAAQPGAEIDVIKQQLAAAYTDAEKERLQEQLAAAKERQIPVLRAGQKPSEWLPQQEPKPFTIPSSWSMTTKENTLWLPDNTVIQAKDADEYKRMMDTIRETGVGAIHVDPRLQRTFTKDRVMEFEDMGRPDMVKKWLFAHMGQGNVSPEQYYAYVDGRATLEDLLTHGEDYITPLGVGEKIVDEQGNVVQVGKGMKPTNPMDKIPQSAMPIFNKPVRYVTWEEFLNEPQGFPTFKPEVVPTNWEQDELGNVVTPAGFTITAKGDVLTPEGTPVSEQVIKENPYVAEMLSREFSIEDIEGFAAHAEESPPEFIKEIQAMGDNPMTRVALKRLGVAEKYINKVIFPEEETLSLKSVERLLTSPDINRLPLTQKLKAIWDLFTMAQMKGAAITFSDLGRILTGLTAEGKPVGRAILNPMELRVFEETYNVKIPGTEKWLTPLREEAQKGQPWALGAAGVMSMITPDWLIGGGLGKVGQKAMPYVVKMLAQGVEETALRETLIKGGVASVKASEKQAGKLIEKASEMIARNADEATRWAEAVATQGFKSKAAQTALKAINKSPKVAVAKGAEAVVPTAEKIPEVAPKGIREATKGEKIIESLSPEKSSVYREIVETEVRAGKTPDEVVAATSRYGIPEDAVREYINQMKYMGPERRATQVPVGVERRGTVVAQGKGGTVAMGAEVPPAKVPPAPSITPTPPPVTPPAPAEAVKPSLVTRIKEVFWTPREKAPPDPIADLRDKVEAVLKTQLELRTAKETAVEVSRAGKKGAMEVAREAGEMGEVMAARGSEAPSMRWGGTNIFTPEDISRLNQHALSHPDIWDTARLGDWIKAITTGSDDVAGEAALDLVKEVLGVQVPAKMEKRRMLWESLNIFRALKSCLDHSFVLRQNILLSSKMIMKGEGKEWAKMVWKTLSTSFRDVSAREYHKAYIEADELYPLLDKYIEFTLPSHMTGTKAKGLIRAEEQFASSIARYFAPVKWAENSAVNFSNSIRLWSGKSIVRNAEKLGIVEIDDATKVATKGGDFLRNMGNVVNAASGRGNLPKAIKGAQPMLNAIFFSPKLMASRVLFPWYMVKYAVQGVKDPAARLLAKECAAMMGSMMTINATLMGLAFASGARLELDPRSADFGKGRWGPSRIDFFGGYLPFVRLAAQMVFGSRKSTTTGGVVPINRMDTLMWFNEAKFQPLLGLFRDLFKGRTFEGEKVEFSAKFVGDEIYNLLIPLGIDDIAEATQATGALGGLVAPPSFFGANVQTYEENLEELQATLGQVGEDGKVYTLGRFGGDVMKRGGEAGIVLPTVSKKGINWRNTLGTDLMKFRYDCKKDFDKYEDLPSPETRRMARIRNPELDAKLFFWGQVQNLQTDNTANRARSKQLVTKWIKQYGVPIEATNYYKLDPKEAERVAAEQKKQRDIINKKADEIIKQFESDLRGE